jgi:hypothetical protein
MRPQPYPHPGPTYRWERSHYEQVNGRNVWIESGWYVGGTYSSPGLWNSRRLLAAKRLGADHPAARAALGRQLEARGSVPQRGLTTPEAIAWHRASGADRGFMNRSHRRAIARRASGAPTQNIFYDHKNRYALDTGAPLPTNEDQRVAPTRALAQGAQ